MRLLEEEKEEREPALARKAINRKRKGEGEGARGGGGDGGLDETRPSALHVDLPEPHDELPLYVTDPKGHQKDPFSSADFSRAKASKGGGEEGRRKQTSLRIQIVANPRAIVMQTKPYTVLSNPQPPKEKGLRQLFFLSEHHFHSSRRRKEGRGGEGGGGTYENVSSKT